MASRTISPPSPPKPKAYSYIRFSSLKQATGDSLRRQKKEVAQWCEQNGLELDEDLTFRDLGKSAFSGANLKVGRLGEFLQLCHEGKIPKGSALIVEELDRLTRREPWDAVKLISQIFEYGVQIHLTRIGKIFDPKKKNGTDLIQISLLAEQAHEEIKRRSARLLDAFEQRRKISKDTARPIKGQSLPWFLKMEGGKIICPDERRKVVLRIFNDTANGLSSQAISNALNQEKVPTWRPGATKQTRLKLTQAGKPVPHSKWNPSRIREFVHSEAVEGVLVPTRKTVRAWEERQEPKAPLHRIEGYYPKIVDSELAKKARLQLVSNNTCKLGRGRLPSPHARLQNILRNLLRYDGRWCRFSVRNNGAHGEPNGYFSPLGDDGKPLVSLPASHVEPILLKALQELRADDLSTSHDPLRAEVLSSRIATLKLEMERLADFIAKNPDLPENCADLLRSKNEECRRAQGELDGLMKIKNSGSGLGEIKEIDVSDLRKKEVRERMAYALRRLVERIDIGKGVKMEIAGGTIETDGVEMLWAAKETSAGFLAASESGDGITFEDPAPLRCRRPLSMLVTFRTGAQRLIIRDVKNGTIYSVRVDPQQRKKRCDLSSKSKKAARRSGRKNT